MEKRTKIIATIGPATSSYEMLQKLSEKGVNVFRLNFSHGDHSSHQVVMDRIKKLNKEENKYHAIMLDTKGPQIRSGDLKVPVQFSKGDELILTIEHAEWENGEKVHVNYDLFVDDVDIDDMILIDGGEMKLVVKSKTKQDVICEVVHGGELTSRRHINIPGKTSSQESITERDWEDIRFGIEQGVDFIALSFVKGAQEVQELKEFLHSQGSQAEIISKIETYEATQNLHEIVDASDAIMVARGDLGAEVSFAEVPRLQRKMVDMCAKKRTPIIVATHMLESMVNSPVPTRAEVTDIFYATWWRSDGLMLSGETAIGSFPLEALDTMVEVIKETEKDVIRKKTYRNGHKETHVRAEIAKVAAQMAEDLDDVKAIIVFTRTGNMVKTMAAFRPCVPIWCFTDVPETQRKTNLLWGVECFEIPFSQKDEQVTIESAKKRLLAEDPYLAGEKYVILSEAFVDDEHVPEVQIRTF